MAIIKCKMCGGDIELSQDKTYGVCDSCGSMMTLPKIDDEQRAAAFNRGNHFRRIGEFDKALGVYERIVQEDENDAEAHWCCALCRFGIEYVEDPTSHEWLPTCHRASFDSFLEDVDYLAALEHSDGVTKRQYQREAAKIAEVQHGILATSQNEKPFDVFICYKESDANGERTRDSLMAQDIYYQLTEQGRRVFFARITLEDKAGAQYEPYIFAALNSAKVMIVVGTCPEHFSAVWVKNEWSRFIALMRKDKHRVLLPCYRDMDPYDLPDQLSAFQSYDMSKIGFIQDLIRGVSKVLDADKAPKQETVIVQNESGANVTAMLKRGSMALEDKNWGAAREFFDRALDMNAECAEAYLGQFLAGEQVSSLSAYAQKRLNLWKLSDAKPLIAVQTVEADAQKAVERYTLENYLPADRIRELFAFDPKYNSYLAQATALCAKEKQLLNENRLFARALQFAKGELRQSLEKERDAFYAKLDSLVEAQRESDRKNAARLQQQYAKQLESANQKAEELHSAALKQREKDERRAREAQEEYYQKLCAMNPEQKNPFECQQIAKNFERLGDYKDCAARAAEWREQVKEANARERAEFEQKCEKAKAAAKAKKIRAVIITAAVIAVIAFLLVLFKIIIPSNHYKKGEALLAASNYEGAISEFQSAGGYKDASIRISEAYYQMAESMLADGDFEGTIAAFQQNGDFVVASKELLSACYNKAANLLSTGDFDGAITGFKAAADYEDAQNRLEEAYYQKGEALLEARDFDGAIKYFEAAGNYENASDRISEAYYQKGEALLNTGDFDGALSTLETISDYKDVQNRILEVHYKEAESLLEDGDTADAAIAFGKVIGYQDARERSFALWDEVAMRDTISAGDQHTVGLKADGTVVAVGHKKSGQCAVSDWRDIIAVSAGSYYTVGLKADGTVVAVGDNQYGRCDVSDWRDIVAVSAGSYHTAGLKADGTVVTVGDSYYDKCDVSDWRDIVAISAGDKHIVGLKVDGTVVAVGDNDDGQCDVSDWNNIVAISANTWHTVGLKADGTVVATGSNSFYQCDVFNWSNIVAISAGNTHTIGLKANGTVVVTRGSDLSHVRDVSDWSDIVAISAGDNHSVGLKADGTVVAVGSNSDGRCNVSSWTGIKLP